MRSWCVDCAEGDEVGKPGAATSLKQHQFAIWKCSIRRRMQLNSEGTGGEESGLIPGGGTQALAANTPGSPREGPGPGRPNTPGLRE